MVWKAKKRSRRRGEARSQNTTTATPLRLKSCLKNSISSSNESASESSSHMPGDSSTGTGRDQSTRSGRSMSSYVASACSTKSRDTGVSEPHSANSTGSGGSGSASKNSRSTRSRRSGHCVEKNVRFGEIQIRDYERVVGDNPSCTTGPPIGIGWAHGDTRTLQVDTYEEARPHRGRESKIVLSREQREEILIHWGVTFNDIIESIRHNIKVKNQRRQTVTNLGKVERLEEAFESASRKLKRAVLMRRRTGEKVKQLQEQAEVAAKALASAADIEDVHVLNEIPLDEGPGESEPENDTIEDLELEVKVAEYAKDATPKAKLRREASRLSATDDQATALSGLTLSNSTSASVREMEKFYRELELEMFGDTPLPNMVGETLEVPGTIPEEERVYHDPPSVSGLREPASVQPPYAETENGSPEKDTTVNKPLPETMPEEVTPTAGPNVPYHANPAYPMQPRWDGEMERTVPGERRSMLSETLAANPPMEKHAVPMQRTYAPPASAPYPMFPPNATIMVQDDRYPSMPNGGLRAVSPTQLSGSQDSRDRERAEVHRNNMARAYLSRTVTAMEQQYLHPSIAPPVPPNSHGYYAYGAPGYDGVAHHLQSGSPRGHHPRDMGLVPDRQMDGPAIRHLPPPTYHSPTYWMEGSDTSNYPQYGFEPITISEEYVYVDGRPTVEYPRYPVQQVYRPTY